MKIDAKYRSKVLAIYDQIPGFLSQHEKRVVFKKLQDGSYADQYEETFFWLSDSMISNECFLCNDPNVGLSLNETRTLCIAGGIALQALATMGIDIAAHIQSLGPEGIADEPLDELERDEAQLAALRAHDFPCISTDAAGRMRAAILAARDDLDSIGGVIECAAYGVPAGVGDPMFDGLENRIARIAFGIPAVKGVDFGSGFAAAYLTGSENNDPFRMVDGQPRPETNNAGGILGGISTGMPIVWQMAVKPTASIGRPQRSVDLDAGADAELTVRGRHDPCIVPRAVPVAEAACALAFLDALLEDGRFPTPAPRS